MKFTIFIDPFLVIITYNLVCRNYAPNKAPGIMKFPILADPSLSSFNVNLVCLIYAEE